MYELELGDDVQEQYLFMAFSRFQPEPKVMSSVLTSTGHVFVGPNDSSGIKSELLL